MWYEVWAYRLRSSNGEGGGRPRPFIVIGLFCGTLNILCAGRNAPRLFSPGLRYGLTLCPDILYSGASNVWFYSGVTENIVLGLGPSHGRYQQKIVPARCEPVPSGERDDQTLLHLPLAPSYVDV